MDGSWTMIEPTPREAVSRSPPPSLLTLPSELRIRIYEYVFSDVVSTPLTIVKFPLHPWKVQHRKLEARTPSVLVVCRQISTEALDVLHTCCGPPTIVVKFGPHAGHIEEALVVAFGSDVGSSDPGGRPGVERNVLRGVTRLRLDVDVTSSYEYQGHAIALLKWIRAVLNGRTSGEELQHLKILFHGKMMFMPKPNDGLSQAVRGIKTAAGGTREAWFVQSAHDWKVGQTEEQRVGMEMRRLEKGVEESEDSARMGMARLVANEQMAEEERQRQWAGVFGWRAYFDGPISTCRWLIGK